MSRLISSAFLSSAVCILAACSSTGNAPSEAPQAVKTVNAPDHSQTAGSGQTGLTKEDLAALRDPANPLSKRSVYFDYDSNLIKPDQRPVVETHGKFLMNRPGVKVTIQGNTDERGSREYNLALGQRRADAMKQALTAYGISGERIETISFGAEKPVAEGHDEKAWAKNRHADIVYPGE